jgi:hypothetical protein
MGVAGAANSAPRDGDGAATIAHRVGREVAWGADGTERLVYHYATDRHKPFVHPLRTAGGRVLTTVEPLDHPWHRGLWFSWKFLNGVNFWEEREHAGEGAGAGFGRTELAGVDGIAWRPERTRVTTRYSYRVPGGAVLLSERRTIGVALPTDGSCTIDWETTVTAGGQSVRIDRTPIRPETPWGGYAGLSFRAAQTWRAVEGLDSEGRRDGEIEHQRARWVAITGVSEGQGRAGLAILDHPDNPRHPSYWRYIDEPGFSYINPSLVLAGPYDLAEGATLRLRYRLIVLDGAPDAAALADRHRAFGAEVAGRSTDETGGAR